MQRCPDFRAIKVNELALLLVGEATTDLNGFVGIFGINLHRLGFLCGFESSHRLLSCAGFGCDLDHGGPDGLEL